MGAVPSTIEQPAVAEPRQPRGGVAALLLVLGCYVLGAVAMTWRLWLDPAGRMQAGDTQDVNLFAWFMRYSATAIGHGHLPALFTTALGAPRGVNLMWNTAFLLPGILLTPVTLLAGPQVSLTLVLTLSFAGSAAALFWVLRRWGASLGAAALGGAVYGFSPAGWPCRGRGPGPRCARGCRTMIWSRGEPLAEQTAAPVRPRRHRVPRDARDPRVPARSFPRRDQVRGWPRRRDRRVPRRIRRCRARCPGPPR